jgi:23S rRNA (uracil1939-C5)-methyltransferase
VGIELSASACDDFAINLHEFDNVELYQGAVEQVLPVLNLRAGTVLIDPPRTGLDRMTRDAILKMEPERVVYVSCDPATLSRDLKYMLQQGYYLTQVTPFDLFPQTFHVETISLLTRR